MHSGCAGNADYMAACAVLTRMPAPGGVFCRTSNAATDVITLPITSEGPTAKDHGHMRGALTLLVMCSSCLVLTALVLLALTEVEQVKGEGKASEPGPL